MRVARPDPIVHSKLPGGERYSTCRTLKSPLRFAVVFDDARLVGAYDRVNTVTEAQLEKRPADVRVDGGTRDEELFWFSGVSSNQTSLSSTGCLDPA